MADFGLLQTPDFARAALSGYQAGSALGKQKQLDAAMSAIDLERPETLLPVLRADPATGAALIGASTKIAAEKRDMASRQATAAYIKTIMPSGAGTATGASPAGTTATVAAAPAPVDGAPGSDQSDIVVNGRPPVDPNAARDAAIDADPNAFLDIQKQIGAMDENQRKRVADATGAFSAVGNALLEIPYDQRRGYIQAHAADLAAHGVPTEKIASFDPTDQNIHYEVGQAIGIKGQLEQHDKDRSFAETQRHNTVGERQGDARIGLEGQSVGIAAGHLALARNADGRAATNAAAKSAPAASAAAVPQYQYRIVNGVTQRRLIK